MTVCTSCRATIPPCNHFDWCPDREVNRLRSDWDDLYERLQKALQELEQMACDNPDYHEASRLAHKADGVALAIDYMRGYGR